MQKIYFKCDDVAEFADLFPGGQYELLQLTKGHFGFSETCLTLPKTSFFLTRYKSGFEMVEVMETNTVAFIFPIISGGFVRWCGQDLMQETMLILRHGEENAFAIQSGADALQIHIQIDLLQSLGWSLPEGSMFRVSAPHRERLLTWCCSKLTPDVDETTNENACNLGARLQVNVLSCLYELLIASGLSGKRAITRENGFGSNYEIIRKIRKTLRTQPDDTILSVPEMAAFMEVSERNIHRAFQNWLGVGPGKYHELQRLHRLRTYMKSEAGPREKLVHIADRFGFSNPGRMAGSYSDLFHERPSETLKRARS